MIVVTNFSHLVTKLVRVASSDYKPTNFSHPCDLVGRNCNGHVYEATYLGHDVTKPVALGCVSNLG